MKHFVAAHVEILAIIESGRKQFSDLTKLFLNHPFTNLDRDLFENNEIDNVADPTLINTNGKNVRKKEKKNMYRI